eukprot:CAMPEP_0194499970 /NCGR_PEP_ID=MMETSP0253-20130528/16106_1 /TAXON_ID=2966 /ORGANISM="Noctiluca scintillans" /LENGTH=119 /DNA_ID=CAMNT_0039341777 /DNA_START=41 /DNA_END=400 /DNA_ORIENTATION=+
MARLLVLTTVVVSLFVACGATCHERNASTCGTEHDGECDCVWHTANMSCQTMECDESASNTTDMHSTPDDSDGENDDDNNDNNDENSTTSNDNQGSAVAGTTSPMLSVPVTLTLWVLLA